MILSLLKKRAKSLLVSVGIFSLLASLLMPLAAQAAEPHFADELRFFVGANTTRNQKDWVNPVSGNAGDEFAGQLFVHNNIVGSVANDVVVRVSIPSRTEGNKAVLSATESAKNADSLSDNLVVNLSDEADVFFEPGSVKLYKVEGENPVQVPLSVEEGNKLVTTGLFLGDIAGCFQYSRFITFEFKTKAKEVPKQPNLHVSKLVRNVSTGEGNFVQSNQAHAGDTLEYKINFSNTGEVEAFNVLLKDVIPPHTKFVNGSAVLSINGGPEQKLNDGDNLVEEGIRLKEIEPRENSYVKFRVVIDSNTSAGTVLTNTAILDGLSATAQTTIVAISAPVVVHKEEKPLPTTGPIETASVVIASMIMAAYGYFRYRKYMATREVKIINDLLGK